jgi:hypothetical protein
LTNASEITVSDPDDDIPLKILKYTGESRPTLVQKDRRHSSTAMPAPSKVFPEATFATSPQPTINLLRLEMCWLRFIISPTQHLHESQ